MKEPINIRVESDDDTTNLALDTIRRGKQALIFVNSKRSAEASAERIGKAVGKQDIRLEELAEKVLNATTKPTKQCKRLAFCVRRAQAFHHAGLTSKQRSLIEDAFREGKIKTISATPTLCLAKGTRVWSGVEEIPVESLTKKQLHVLDQNTIVQITNESVVSKTNSQPLMQIRCASGKSIQATSNHRFYVKRNNKKQVVELRNIQKTDKIATIGRIHVTEKTVAVSEFTKNYSSPKDYVFDTDLAYFIGVMLGDGYSGATITDESLIFKSHGCLVSHDKEIRDAAITISKKFNLSHRLSKNSHGVPQVFLSKTNWFREFLARCGIHQSVDKHLAKKLQKLPKRELAALLRGYFDTDGYIQKRGSIGVSSISLQLIKDVQKMLLRFNIPTRFRSRPASSMKTGNKEYKTKKQYELTIAHTKAIRNFSQHIGFGVARKSKALATLVDQQEIIQSVSCPTCNYAISKNLFDGRTKEQQSWGKKKLQVIQTLGACGELGSNELTKKLGFLPRKKENRLNAHYSLIQKRKIGSRSKTEWYWSLNAIGKWVYEKAKNHSFDVSELLEKNTCPVCTNELQKTLRKNWRSNDMDGDIFWDVIREIKTIPAQETVYDVVLPNTPKNDHLFVAEGFFTHNSAGVDTPAFRTIIRDTKRFTGAGMSDIPVLEYHQMAGRSGRPDYGDDYGEAILIAKNDAHAEQLTKKYVYGEPEAIYSKVAAQPVLRTYCLSLAASEFVQTTNELQAFFADTFFAHQYGDASEIKNKILNTIEQLRDWGFLESHKQEATADFTSASELTSTDEKIKATPLGKRVSELYIDPLSAHELIDGMYKASTTKPEFFAWLHLVSSAAEARPLLRVKATDYEPLQEFLAQAPELLVNEPSIYDPSYEQYLEAIKTAKMLEAWASEVDEEDLLEKYNVRPGELRRRLDIADWLCYSASELARILQFHHHISPLQKTRYRLKYGAKEELLALLKLRNIGRVRARKLYRNNIRSAGDIKKADVKTLTQLTGPKTAINLKKQVGEEVATKPSTQKRKGQLSLHAKRFKK